MLMLVISRTAAGDLIDEHLTAADMPTLGYYRCQARMARSHIADRPI